MKKVIILLGYDYVSVLQHIVCEEHIFCLILESDKKYFSYNSLSALEKLMGARLYHSNITAEKVKDIVFQTKVSILITIGWRRIIDVANYKTQDYLINIHPALLPEYKGYHPVPYVIMNEEKIHGITAHLITSDLDAGDILLQETFPTNPFSTLSSLQDEVIKRMPGFLKRLINTITADEIALLPNNAEKTIITAPRRKPEDSRIDPSDTIFEVFKKVKASDPQRFPAYFEHLGEKIFIFMKRSDQAERENRFDI